MEGSLKYRVLGLPSEDMLGHLFAAAQHLGGLATDEEAALRFWLGAAYSKYEEVAALRDLAESDEEYDIERWHGIVERLEEAVGRCAAAFDALKGAKMCRVGIVGRTTVPLIVTHKSRDGSVKATFRSERGVPKLHGEMPCARFAESVVRGWSRAAQGMGATDTGGPRRTFDCIDGESLEFLKEDADHKLLVRVVAEQGMAMVFDTLHTGVHNNAFFDATTGRQAMLRGDFVAAAQSYEAACEADPADASYQEARASAQRLGQMKDKLDAGLAAQASGRPEEALELFVAGSKLDLTDDAPARSNLYNQANGMRLRGDRFLPAATQMYVQALTQAVEIKPLPEDDQLPAKPVLAIRWGVTGSIWKLHAPIFTTKPGRSASKGSVSSPLPDNCLSKL